MAKNPPSSDKPIQASSTTAEHKKLPRLDKDHKISKRPLLHPAISAPRSGSQNPKVIYISPSTPFIATVKRVRKLLGHIEDRATGPLVLGKNPRDAVRAIQNAVNATGKGGDGGRANRGEEVVMKGTGRAIERVLQLALYWQGQADVKVAVRTGSVGAIDDVVGAEDGEEVGESRVRRVSRLEVGVRLV